MKKYKVLAFYVIVIAKSSSIIITNPNYDSHIKFAKKRKSTVGSIKCAR